MDFLDSLDLHTDCRKSKRVRSWYLYEQYKSLEKSQLDAARKLKDRSYQDRILHRELSERRARRQLSEQFDLPVSECHIERTINSDSSRTHLSESKDSLFESVCEQEDFVNEQEDFVNEKEDIVNDKSQEDTVSQHSDTSKCCDNFKSSDDKNINSCSESIKSVIEKTEINRIVAEDIKDELELVKNNIAEIINMQIETEKECLEKINEFCDEKCCDIDNVSLKSMEKCVLKQSKSVDKYYPKYDNGLFAIWSKLVAFSYNVMQMNRGNCYYDYSSQFLMGVLACDVLRRGISRMCDILQPFICPIKYAISETDTTPLTKDTRNHKTPNTKTTNIIDELRCRPLSTLKSNEKYRSFERKYHSEDKWQSCCKYSYENIINEKRGASEPWRSVTKFSGGKNSFKNKLPCKCDLPLRDDKKYSNFCKCQQFKKAINPIIKLSHYIDMILKEIED